MKTNLNKNSNLIINEKTSACENIDYIIEAYKADTKKTGNQYFKFNFKTKLWGVIPKVNQTIHFFVGENSGDFFNMFGEKKSDEVSKFVGIPKDDYKKHIEKVGNEKNDALVYGMSNVVGTDVIYQWHNGTRLKGAYEQFGIGGIIEELSHESIHTTRLVLNRQHAQNKNEVEKWIENPWLAIGDEEGMIDEEMFATTQGLIVQGLTEKYLEFIKPYVDLKF